MSGRRDSNPRPSAWKADALPTELLPLITVFAKNYGYGLFQKSRGMIAVNHPSCFGGGDRIRTYSVETPDLQSGPALQLRRTPMGGYNPTFKN